jgi:hypothetical protein
MIIFDCFRLKHAIVCGCRGGLGFIQLLEEKAVKGVNCICRHLMNKINHCIPVSTIIAKSKSMRKLEYVIYRCLFL